MNYELGIGSQVWLSNRRINRRFGTLKAAYVKRDTMGPVKPDRGCSAAWGCRDCRFEEGYPKHRGGLTVAPAPCVPQIPAAFLPVSATRHVVAADEPAMFGILDPRDELEAADLYRKSEKEND